MRTRTIFFLTALLLSCVNVALSQDKTPEERAKILTEKMTKSLLLSTEQQEKVLSLNTGVAQKNEAIRKNVNMNEEQKKEAIKGNLEGRKSGLQLILNEEQFKKYERMEAKRKAQIEKKRKENKQTIEQKDDL
ncbi:MAG: hypothetical protein RIT43_1583 [Bacteroidota bacterium]|jgi:long-subunit acyl-CoA synthetase (AMP-forming)